MSLAAPEPADRGFRIKGWHVFAGVSLFFAVVIAVDVLFTVIAVRTFPGEVSVTPYEDGLLYNKKLARLSEQAKLGWRAAAEPVGGTVVVRMRDASGGPLVGLTVKGKLQRPATEAGSADLVFQEAAPGIYVAQSGVRSGAWDLTLTAGDRGAKAFEAERRLTWR